MTSMHAGEVQTDEGLVRRLLAAQFPTWAGLPVERVPSGGTVNAIYRVGTDLSVRLPRIAWGAREPRELEGHHRLLLDLAPRLPVAIPEPLGIGRPSGDYPFTWEVHRWIEGEVPTIDGVAHSQELAADLADVVTALRGIDTADGPPSPRGRPPELSEAELEAGIEALRGVADEGLVIAAWEASRRAPAWDGLSVWVHADLLPGNLLMEDGRLCGVLDFELLGVGDPAVDLIPAWSVLSGGARDVFRARIEADEAMWLRARGWALAIALPIIPYYPETNPGFVAMATRMVKEVLADHRRDQLSG